MNHLVNILALAAGQAAQTAQTAPLGIGIKDAPGNATMVWMAALIIVCAAAAIALKLKSKQTPATELIEVLGQHGLGGRSRLMLIAARGRELLLSVDEKGARLLVEWPLAGAAEPDPTESTEASDAPDTADLPSPSVSDKTSDAISGLMRLREHTNPRIPVPTMPPPAPRYDPRYDPRYEPRYEPQTLREELAAEQHSFLREEVAMRQLPATRRAPAAFPQTLIQEMRAQQNMRKVSR